MEDLNRKIKDLHDEELFLDSLMKQTEKRGSRGFDTDADARTEMESTAFTGCTNDTKDRLDDTSSFFDRFYKMMFSSGNSVHSTDRRLRRMQV